MSRKSAVAERRASSIIKGHAAASDGAKLEIKNNVQLSERWGRVDASANDYFLEVIEPTSGKLIGSALIKTSKGAFQLSSVESSGDWLVAADSTNRLLVFSLESGKQIGTLFGRRPVISTGTSLLAAQNERGELSLYDLKTLTRKEEYFFKSRIAFVYFAADNRRLFVLTGDQTAYFLALPKGESAKVEARSFVD